MPAANEAFAVALAHYRAGRLHDAEEVCQRILGAGAESADVWNLLGVIAFQQGQDAVAFERLRRALQLDPGHVNANNNLGTVFKRQGKLADAIACHRRAVELLPNSAEALNNLGTALRDSGDSAQASEYYRRAIAAQPSFPEAYYNLGVMLQQEGKHAAAAGCYRRAMDLRPGFEEARLNLGIALKDLGKLDEAIDCFRFAVERQPANPDTLFELGRALHGLGRRDDALAAYNRALEIDLNHASAHFHRAMLMLAAGDFDAGWAEYEWRSRTSKQPQPQFRQPQWEGEGLAGKTILLCAEQGLGDTIQFIRYAALVKRLGATVVVECQRPLVKLLGSCPGVDRLVAAGDTLSKFECYAPLLSLPRILQTRLDTIPADAPYLWADAGLVDEWRVKLTSIKGFRIGINWRGGQGQTVVNRRDIPHQLFANLGSIPGVKLINLQKGISEREPAEFRDRFPIPDLGEFDEEHGAFMDTAAIMMNLDLVITSDTSIAHLAGALGVPVWVAVPHVAEWRWLLERSDSPWYPTMRLVRQPRPGDWESVFAEICAALKDIIHQINGLQ